MPAELIARVEDVLGVALVEGYEALRGSCASTLNPFDGVRKPGTVGLPLPGQEVQVAAARAILFRRESAGRSSSAAPT